MIEINLFKYVLLNKEQNIFLKYLVSPPFKTNSKRNNAIYK